MLPLKKRCELDRVLSLLSKGFTKDQIRNKLNLRSSTLANRLRRLENLGCIERKGKYIVKVLRSSSKNPQVTKNQVHKKLNKRGHAYNFKIIFPKEEDLRKKDKVINEFKLKKLEKLPFDSYKLKKDKNTIWINKDSLTIYSSNSFYSENALHSKFRSLKDIDNLINYLIGRFNFNGIYGIEIFREHYGLIFNKFAKWLLSKNKKMYVRNHGNKVILWIDNSRKDDIGLEELESQDPLKINSADKLFNSHEKTNWEVTPEFVLDSLGKTSNQIKKNAENLDYHAENMRAHVGATKNLSKAANQISNNLERQNKLFESMVELLKNVNK